MTSPVQIIKYANRTEFRNIGYSLKPQEQLGLPGSVPRNEILAQVFQDIHYAEAKGTGISTMREEMKKANLSVPLIESDRASNLFVLTLLPHHLFDSQDIQWLQSFKDHHLNDEEARTLIIIREKGSISNAEYRTINGVDTLAASSHLRRLRDLELLEQRGRGNATYYVPTLKLMTGGVKALTPHISSLYGELTPHISSLNGEFILSKGLTEEIKDKIKNLKKRTPPQKIRSLIRELCDLQPLKLSEIATLLDRHPKYIRENYLNHMVKNQELEYVFNDPNHPQQAYRSKRP
jgi:ATP-dependent DNA helicase RecG